MRTSHADACPGRPSPITKESLTVLLRKLGLRFTEVDRDDLYNMMDPNKVGCVIFRDFCLSFNAVKEKNEDRFSFYKCAALSICTPAGAQSPRP
jgi:hypothetical protein